MKFKPLLSLIAALSMSMLAACGGGDDLQGQVRLVNATVEYAALDFYQSDTLLAGNVASDTGSGYIGLDKDDYTFKLKRPSTGSTSLSTDQSIGREEHKTLLAYATGKVLKSLYLSDDEDKPSSGNTRLRVFNTSTEAGALDIYLTDADTDLETVVPDVQTTVETLTGFSDFRSGTYRLRATASGDKTDVRLDIPNFTLGGEQVSTLVLTSSTGGVLVNGLLLNQQSSIVSAKNPSARVRLVANASNKGLVSAMVNGTVLASSQLSPQVGGYTLVPAGTWALNITVNGGAISPPTALTPAAAVPGADYTLMVYGTAGQVALITDDNRLPSSTTGAKLRLVNGVNGLTGALTLRANLSNVASNLALGNASAYSTLTAADYDLDVTSPSSLTSLYAEADKTLQSGGIYTVFMLGDASASTHLVQRDR